MTLLDLESKANIAAGTLSRYERALSQPTLDKLLAIQNALDLNSLEELIGPVTSPYLPSKQLWTKSQATNETDSTDSAE